MNRMHISTNLGFTFIEVVVVMAVSLILISLSVVSLSAVQQSTYVNTSLERLVSDLRYQQIQAMNGARGGTTSPQAYGIHFETTNYTLFQGSTFNPLDEKNYTVQLEGGVQFSSIQFPNSQVVFDKGSGEIIGFIEGQNTVVLRYAAGDLTNTITLNKLGVITQAH